MEVLIVDDDLALGRLVAEALKEVVGVSRATTVTGALAILQRKKIDLILTDLHMPGGTSGLELCRKLGRASPNLPIIVMTGDDATSDEVIYEAGAVGLLRKPFDISVLISTVKSYL